MLNQEDKSFILTERYLPDTITAKLTADCTLEDILTISKSLREFAENRDKNGEYPLHIIVKNGGSIEVVSEVYRLYPTAIKEKFGSDNHLVLHQACEPKSAHLLLPLLQLYPEGALVRGRDDNTLLHTAVKKLTSAAAVTEIIACNRDATRTKNTYSKMPLHYAVSYGVSTEVVLALISADPGAAAERSRQDELPLHMLLSGYESATRLDMTAVATALLQALPGSIEKDNGYYHQLPLSIALDNKCTPDVVLMLLQAYPAGMGCMQSIAFERVDAYVFICVLVFIASLFNSTLVDPTVP
jgi:hypothetical protein